MLTPERYDTAVPTDARLGAVLLHPHPSYGGDRRNSVVQALFDALPAAGIAAVRFDFASDAIDAGAADAADAITLLPDDVPVAIVGYSFGAVVAAQVLDERIAGWGLVAPPFGRLLPGADRPIGGDIRPKLLLAADHDQFCQPDALRREVAGWRAADVDHVAGADHFLAGATAAVATRVAAWLRELRL